MKFGRTAISTLNGRISETKRDFLDPLVPKFSYDRGLSPTLSWKWPSATLSPSFGLFQSEKPLFRGVPGVSRCLSLVRICPRDRFRSRKFFFLAVTLQKILPRHFVISFVEVFFTHFHSARLKTLYILPPLPPIQPNHPPHAPPPQNDHVISNKWYFVFHTLWFRHSKHHFSVQHAFTKGVKDLG